MVIKTPWLTIPQPNPQARLRLFCFPYAGAGSSVFRTWCNLLSEDMELCAIQLPGRETRLREPLFTQLQPLIENLAPVLPLNLPFAFFGHSLGALISFELTRQLRRLDQPLPLHLFVSGRVAPQKPLPNPPIHQLPLAEFKAELRKKGGTPEAVLQNAELMELFLPILRADLEINDAYCYSPEAPLACPISAFCGLQDEEASREHMEAWQEQTCKEFTLHLFPGDHFFFKREQRKVIESLVGALRSCNAP